MKVLKKIMRILPGAVGVLLAAAIGLFVYLQVTEFSPDEIGTVEVTPAEEAGAQEEAGEDRQTLTVLTWNTGFGCLGDNADFFMDGGKGVKTATKERMEQNVNGMIETIRAEEPDVIFLQETDRDSTRSSHEDQTQMYRDAFTDCSSAFANNFKVAFLPYPIPPIGKVDSGLLTLTSLEISEAERISLPCPFSWPVRLVNLKRCLLMTRVPLENGSELVLINLHLEAYDDGEGKAAQTAQLRSILEEEAEAGNYVIAGGDFNQTFSDVDLTDYPVAEGMWAPGLIDTDDFSDDWQLLMDGSLPSCRSLDQPYEGAGHDQFQYYIIDGFIVSGNLKVTRFETLDAGFTCTDHNPVILEVEL